MTKRYLVLPLLLFLFVAFAVVYFSPAVKLPPLEPFPLSQPALEPVDQFPLPNQEMEIEQVPWVEELPQFGEEGFHLTEEEINFIQTATGTSGGIVGGDIEKIRVNLNVQIDTLVDEMEQLRGPLDAETEQKLRRWIITQSSDPIYEATIRSLTSLGFDIDDIYETEIASWASRAQHVGLIADLLKFLFRLDQPTLARFRENDPNTWRELITELESLTISGSPVGQMRTDVYVLRNRFAAYYNDWRDAPLE